ncbi:MAG: hypothetical protein ACI9DF_003405 [Verrucomicrobiales bacterium]|jgi:hypothetical protein
MGQLKPSEVRLLLIFGVTVLLLGSFFLYEWYARGVQAVNAEKIELQAQRNSLLTMKTQQNEFNQKRVWLRKHQPVARDEFEAKEVLDRVVSVQGIEAAGLTLISAPPEKDPRLEPYYWAFERRVIVSGGIQNIVQWLVTLQSEKEFRAITHLHVFPKKKKEPEALTCEVVIEQRFATEGILAMTSANMPSVITTLDVEAPVAGAMAPVVDNVATEGAAAKPTTTTTKRIITPSATPPSFNDANQNEAAPAEKPAVSRPRVRLPGGPPSTGGEQTNASGAVGSGVLANARRSRVGRGPTPPPPMSGDITFAEENGQDPLLISTGIERIQDAVGDAVPITVEPTSIPVDAGVEMDAPGPPTTFQSISRDGIVGEDWDQNSPGAGGEAAEVGMDEAMEAPDTN